MLINVTGRQLEITPAIQSQAEKVLSPLDLPTLKVTGINVVMSREKSRFKASLVLNCKYHTLTAEVEDFDLYRALDAAAKKVDAQCQDLKNRIQTHRAVAMGDAGPDAAETEPAK